MSYYFKSIPPRFTGRILRVLLVLLAVGVIASIRLLENQRPDLLNQTGWIALYIAAGGLLAYAISAWGLRVMDEHQKLNHLHNLAGMKINRLQRQQQVVLEIGRKLVEATDEQEIIDQVLQLSLEVTGASGASFVPFDEREQPAAASSQGILPLTMMDPWAEHLASQNVRDRCQTCEKHQAGKGGSCPLVESALQTEFPGIQHVHCITLRCGERKVGMMTLYLEQDASLDPEVDAFLRMIMDETALGLESIRLRKREYLALQQLQSMRQKSDLEGVVSNLLGLIQQTMEADFAVLLLSEAEPRRERVQISQGKLDDRFLSLVDGVLHGVSLSKEPVIMNDISGSNQAPGGTISILAAPLTAPEGKSIGAVLIGNDKQLAFNRRQLDLLKTLAGHLALQVSNTTLIAELEFKTMLEERTRLAREIHDGLAQTLGFLKLQVAQLQNYLKRAEFDRLEKGLHTSYVTLSDAYLEVRDAIDGLRATPADENAELWIKDLLLDFESACGIHTELIGCEHLHSLPAEIQVQLIRIVQEALSNVRKHSHATRVAVTCRRLADEIVLEISDNGRGFSPDEVSAAAQYGLRGMRERAELIGADFQVMSIKQQGTTIHLAVYMPKKEKA